MKHSEYEDSVIVPSWDDEVEMIIEYSMIGDHHPAKWDWDGGTPEEFPEIVIDKMYRSDDPDMNPVKFEEIFGKDLVSYDGWKESIMEKWFEDREMESLGGYYD